MKKFKRVLSSLLAAALTVSAVAVANVSSVSATTVWHKFFVSTKDLPTGEDNDTSFFTGTTTGTNSLASTVTIDGTTYNLNYRTSSASPTITFTVPTGNTGILYIVARSSGSASRTLTLKCTDANTSINNQTRSITATSSSAPTLITFDSTAAGNYSLTADANYQYSLIAMKLTSDEEQTEYTVTGNLTSDNELTEGSFTLSDGTSNYTATINGGTYSSTFSASSKPATLTASKAGYLVNGQESVTVTLAASESSETALTATPDLTFTANTFEISGTVTCEEEAIKNATVQALDGEGNELGKATTDSKGTYAISISNGKTVATIKVTAQYYNDYTEEVALTASATKDISITAKEYQKLEDKLDSTYVWNISATKESDLGNGLTSNVADMTSGSEKNYIWTGKDGVEYTWGNASDDCEHNYIASTSTNNTFLTFEAPSNGVFKIAYKVNTGKTDSVFTNSSTVATGENMYKYGEFDVTKDTSYDIKVTGGSKIRVFYLGFTPDTENGLNVITSGQKATYIADSDTYIIAGVTEDEFADNDKLTVSIGNHTEDTDTVYTALKIDDNTTVTAEDIGAKYLFAIKVLGANGDSIVNNFTRTLS
jgi:hypothetical protein